MKKRNDIIAISGYYGFKNIGDEAILYSMLHTLRKAESGIQPIVFSNAPKWTSSMYKVKAVNRWNIRKVSSTLLKSRLLISGGGSLLQDVTGLKSLMYYLGVVALARLLRKKVMFYAQGIGPIKSGTGKLLLKYIGNKVDLITVRDEASKNLLRDIGVTKPPIKVTVDPVLGLRREQINLDKGRDILQQTGIQSHLPVVGISIRNWKDYTNYKQAVAETADFIARQGYQVLFIPFHFPNDIAACRETMRYMKEKAFLIKNSVTVEEMLSLVGNLDMMIGMRLHSLIMAAVMQVPMIGISYDPKVDNFLKIVCQPNAGRVETITAEIIKKNTDKVLSDLQSIQADLRETVDNLNVKAQETVADVFKLLRKNK